MSLRHALLSLLPLLAAVIIARPAQAAVLINEIDADQVSTDAAEFVELYNDAATPVSLDGHVLVFFNGSNDLSYAAFDLDGDSIAANGYYVLGSAMVANANRLFPGATDQLQNGQDAIALYQGNASDFPNGTAVQVTNLVDALVYDTDDADDAGLLVLHNASQPQINENGGGNGTGHSIQRQPDGAGGARNSSAFITANPTPGASNGGLAPPPVAEFKRIHEIQGAQHRSPFENQTLRTRGIVSSVFELSGSNKGFYIQDPDGDGNPATSEAVLVFTASATPTVAVGDEVSVTGRVTEFRPGGASTLNLTTTELTSPVVVVESGSMFTSALTPTIIGLGGRVPPNQVVDDDTTGGDVEAAASTLFDPTNDGVDFYESLEGMWVQVNDGLVTGPTNGFGEVFLVPDAGMGATGLNARGGITLNLYGPSQVDYNPERIQIDDEFFRAEFGEMPAAKVGDTASSLQGVLSYNFGNFEILPSLPPVFADGGLVREITGLSLGGDRLSIANYNVENLDLDDDDICNGSAADNDVADGRFEAVARQVVSHLKSPDILALQEVQDDSGCTDDGTVVATQTLARVVAAIVAAGGPSYTAVEIAPVNNTEGGQPSGNIRVAYLYNAARVALVPGTLGVGGSLDATTPTLDADGKLALSYSPGRIDPTNAAWNATRVSLAAMFEFNGHRLLTINNHWSSKGGSSPILGRTQPFVNGSEDDRSAQAGVVKAFVDQTQGVQPDARIAVLGDLNEFGFNRPLRILSGELVAGTPDSAGTPVLFDLADATIGEANERYSYVFEGNAQALDHIYVSASLLGADVEPQFDAVHINSEFPDQLSDHDPDLASFLLLRAPVPLACVAGPSDNLIDRRDANLPQVLTGRISQRNVIFGSRFPDLITGGSRADCIDGGAGSDVVFGLAGDDTLIGADGADLLSGGAGLDVLDGGAGRDIVDGGAGKDRCAAGEGDLRRSCESQ